MTNTGIRGTLHLAVMIGAMAMVTGCSSTATHWSDAKRPPSGYMFSNGMAPSSEGPPPIWYVRRFNLPRGLGEAIKQYRESVWERGPGTFAYFVGGKFYAQYQPWQHYLQIRTDNEGQVNVSCHWDANGVLTISEVGGGKAPAGAEATCKQLLSELESYVAPEWMVAHNKKH
jgi:hypothetical protein